mmetsp:Transcript_21586/g.50367  ORF Transcript_21586/g.50367 Transcript_21586/m.50367 type:complete len:80 (+) Transcript_21586:1401-1640(+)
MGHGIPVATWSSVCHLSEVPALEYATIRSVGFLQGLRSGFIFRAQCLYPLSRLRWDGFVVPGIEGLILHKLLQGVGRGH